MRVQFSLPAPMKKILVIVGPTASGKSALAVHLAKKFGGEVISADSRQIYKGLDTGTGKITKKEMLGVKHHLLDVASPKRQFTVAEYKKLVEEKLKRINFPIIVGGTGFYIDAVSGQTNFPNVTPNKKLRKNLEKKSVDELFKTLKKKDSRRAKTIDRNNKVRLIRALEIVEALGKVPNIKHKESNNFVYIGLKPDNLDKKIKERLLKRLEPMILECKRLHKQGLSWRRMFRLGLEYRFVSLYLQGKLSKKDMVEKLNTAIKQYAKRQMTWFQRNKKIKWFRPDEYKKMEEFVGSALF